MSRPFWIHVTDCHSNEVLLSRQMTAQEWESDKTARDYAEEALDYMLPLDDEEATYPHCADIEVTFYRNKKEINGAVCFSTHGFYTKRQF
jgi:hypothetical protein